MRRVMIEAWTKGLVFKNGTYKRVLDTGNHWIGFGENVIVQHMSKQFVPNYDLNILLTDKYLAGLLHVIEVKDNEIAMVTENGNFRSVLTAGKHAFWRALVEYKFDVIDLNSLEPIAGIDTAILIKVGMNSFVRTFTVESYEKGLLVIDGKFIREVEAGTYYFWKNATSIQILKVDLRQLQVEISGQEILTKDKAALRINFYAQYKVASVQKVLLESKDADKQLYYMLQLVLRAYMGALTLDELLDKKESASDFVTENVKSKAAELGFDLIGCGIRDIILPGDVKEIMNQVLVAEKKAQANTIMRREETASTRSLLNTAKLMEDNAMLFKLKEMEYVEKIADKINSISVSGGNMIVDQLKQIFVPNK